MNARTAPHYYLHIASGSWQWRIEAAADVQIRHAMTHEVIAALTPAQVVLMAAHYIGSATITAELLERQAPHQVIRRPLAPAPSRTPLRAVGVPLRPAQEARRVARAARVGRAGRKKA